MDAVGWLCPSGHVLMAALAPGSGSWLLSIILVLILILINGFFSASEMAIITLNANRMKHKAEEGDRFARRALRILENPGSFLATIQVGVTLAGFLSSAFAGDQFGDMLYRALDPAAQYHGLRGLCIVLVTLITAYVTLIFGELVPKRIALNNPEAVSRLALSTIRVCDIIARPFTKFLNFSTNLVLKALHIEQQKEEAEVTEEEIRMMIEAGFHSGKILTEESLMLQNVFEFNDKEVSEIMTHRKNISGLPIDASYDEVLQLAKEEGYTRIPIYEEHMDRIVGILNIKDLLYFISKYDRKIFDVTKLMREPLFTPESKHVDALFREMQKRHEAMAIVIDEYGGVAGLVTMEDLLEEIVGNIQDEFDDEHPEIVRNSDGSYDVEGLTELHEICTHVEGFCVDADQVDADTIAGLVLDRLDRIPDEDERPSVDFGKFRLQVLAMDEKRIARLRIIPQTEEAAEAGA